MPSRRSLAALALTLALIAPQTAEAQGGFTWRCELCEASDIFLGVVGAIGGTAVLVLDVILIAEAIDKGGAGHGLYTRGAVIELIDGLVHLGGGIAGFVLAAAPGESAWLGLGIPASMLGTYFIVHAIWSMAGGRPPPLLEPTIAPLAGGLAVGASGRF